MAGREYRYVASSNIQGIAYDVSTKTLFVQFKNGAEYAYYQVPEEEYEAMLSASSAGGYLNDNIKNSYSYSRV